MQNENQDRYDYTSDQQDYVMLTPNAQLMSGTWADMSGYWGVAIGTFLVVMLVSLVGVIIPLGGILIGGPLALGWAKQSLAISRRQTANVSQLFDGFNHFGTAIGAYLLMVLIILGFALLLIVPGIIAALYLSMTMYVLADNPNMPVADALRESKRIMEGNKAKLFRLFLRFAGLGILCILTLGIGYLWLYPFQKVTLARFYEDISGSTQSQNSFGSDDLIDQM